MRLTLAGDLPLVTSTLVALVIGIRRPTFTASRGEFARRTTKGGPFGPPTRSDWGVAGPAAPYHLPPLQPPLSARAAGPQLRRIVPSDWRWIVNVPPVFDVEVTE